MRSLIDIGSKRVEVSVTGKGQSVVILPGLASSIYEWELLTNELSNHAQVIIFHRSGCGRSELDDEKRNTSATVKDLFSLLNRLDVDGPVILVGHSYGGLCAQHFAFVHPEKVHSVVLVESNSADYELLNEVIGPQSAQWSTMYRAFAKMAEDQIKDRLKPQLSPEIQKYSADIKERVIQFKINPSMYQALADELDEMPKCAETIKKYGAFNNIPLIVIGRDPERSIQLMVLQGMPEEQARKIELVWQDLIKGQMKLSATNQYMMASSGHGVYVEDPDIIIKAILALLD
ncbi:alpha/beta fold hydrolase [Brevibacillus reuszeri]|uniref:alpha/beta fold hydrolase n=1 Tax=Brevibacillus reuszeri TaxID=54915 RepID=UPI00289FB7BA|nr:alpha/beta hydrolase [Brevibacillus reuszeri]